MGKRSQGKSKWTKRHDVPTGHTNRIWICADCRKPTQLINCNDGKQRCTVHKAEFDNRVLIGTME